MKELFKVGDYVMYGYGEGPIRAKIVAIHVWKAVSCYCFKTNYKYTEKGRMPSCSDNCSVKLCAKDPCITCYAVNNAPKLKRISKIEGLIKIGE